MNAATLLETRARDHRVARALCRAQNAPSGVMTNDVVASANDVVESASGVAESANDVVASANDVVASANDVVATPVTNLVGEPVDGNWMFSVEKSLSPVTHPVGHPVNQTWTFLDLELVHKFGSCHPPNTDDVRPSCCGYESFMTPRGC